MLHDPKFGEIKFMKYKICFYILSKRRLNSRWPRGYKIISIIWYALDTHRLVAEKEEHAMELELTVQRLNDDQVDKDSLLDSMQSDKTALSRAIAQNRELKTQLAELQNGFVKMVSWFRKYTV